MLFFVAFTLLVCYYLNMAKILHKQIVLITKDRQEWMLTRPHDNSTMAHRSFGRPAVILYKNLWRRWYEFGRYLRGSTPTGGEF